MYNLEKALNELLAERITGLLAEKGLVVNFLHMVDGLGIVAVVYDDDSECGQRTFKLHNGIRLQEFEY